MQKPDEMKTVADRIRELKIGDSIELDRKDRHAAHMAAWRNNIGIKTRVTMTGSLLIWRYE
jgi:hypothetical protein